MSSEPGDDIMLASPSAAALSKRSSRHDSTTGIGGATVRASDAALRLPPIYRRAGSGRAMTASAPAASLCLWHVRDSGAVLAHDRIVG